jgi:uroporphyrin-III C-methyltransferase
MNNATDKKTVDNEPRKRCPFQKAGAIGLMLIVLLCLVVAGYFYCQKNFAHRKGVQSNFLQVQKNISTIEHQVQQLAENAQSQSQIINSLQQAQASHHRYEWLVLQAEFLVKLANDKLRFDNNVEQAIQLLQTADQEISASNDARLQPVRQALIADLAQLQAVPKVDVPGLYMRLLALSNQITKLPLPNKPTAETQVQTQTDESLPWWKRGLHQTFQALRQVVTVRYNQNGKAPLILPEQQDFLYQNIQAAIEKAMWGLLHQQPDIYRSSLQQASEWIKQYFVMDSSVTQSVVAGIDELQAIDIKPATPQISASLQAFRQYFTSSEQ